MSAFQKIMNTLLVFPFCCMFVIVPLQWGWSTEGKELNLPLSAKRLTVIGMHEGKYKQVVSYDSTNNSWVGTDQTYAILYISLCN